MRSGAYDDTGRRRPMTRSRLPHPVRGRFPRPRLLPEDGYICLRRISWRMATIRVQPLPDGVDQKMSWQVKKSGERVSSHLKKSAAKRKAYEVGSSGDDLFVHGTGGEVLRERTMR